jgi:hypothetical protein
VQRFLILAAMVVACSAHDAPATLAASIVHSPGSIEGDVYLSMRSGDTKRATGRVVALLRNTDSAQMSADRACLTYHVRLNYLLSHAASIRDSEANIPSITPLLNRHLDAVSAEMDGADETMRRAVNAGLAQYAVDTTGTGMNAHYRFTNVKPGKYLVWSDFPIGRRLYAWLLPVEVTAGQTVRRDLDASGENGRVFHCGAG